jgi:hypothetical protein
MKKKLVLTGIISLLLVFGMALISCGDKNSGDPYSPPGTDPDTVATPTASPAAGALASGTEVALSTTTDGAIIYYTIDGSIPTTSSEQYSSAIPVTAALTIKAIAAKSGMTNSSVLTAAYTITPPSDDSMGTATTMADGVWTSGAAISPEGDVDWYKFEADSLKTYNLTWDDGKAPNSGSYTGDVMVAAYREDGSAMTSSYWDNGYASVSISAYTGTVYIKVVGYESYVYPSSSFTSDKTGSYRIKYTEN